jgi:hypothetical protein
VTLNQGAITPYEQLRHPGPGLWYTPPTGASITPMPRACAEASRACPISGEPLVMSPTTVPLLNIAG